MNKRERVDNILAGLSVDRPPVCFWRHFGPVAPEETVRQHLTFFHEADLDILKMMCDEFFTYPMDENASPAEILSMRPLGRSHVYVRGQAERAGQINEALKGGTFTLYNAFSPYATLKHTLGDEKSMELIREHEDAALHLMQIICEDTCYMIEAVLKESGTAGMMLPLQGAEINRFGEDEYMRLIRPTEQQVIDCAAGLSDTNLLHLCGWDNIANRLEWWDKYPARMINWDVHVEGVDLAEGRRRFPGRVLLGGFNNREGELLHAGTKEAIQAETRRLVREAGPEQLIIGADCSLPMDVDPVRIRWVIEALEDQGGPDASCQ